MAQFSYKHAEWTVPGSRILIHLLELNVRGFKYFQGSHAFAMLPIKSFTGVLGTLTTLYRTLCILLPACLLALYGSSMQCTSTLRRFSDNSFFLLSVWSSLKKYTCQDFVTTFTH